MVWALTATGTGGGVDVLDVPGIGSGFDDVILDDADALRSLALVPRAGGLWNHALVIRHCPDRYLARWLRRRHEAEMEKVFSTMLSVYPTRWTDGVVVCGIGVLWELTQVMSLVCDCP